LFSLIFGQQNLFAIHFALKDKIPDFLATFAPRADGGDKQICKFREDLIKFGIRTYINLISTSIGAVSMGVAGPLLNQAFAPFMESFSGALVGSGGLLDVQKTFGATEATLNETNANFKLLPGQMANTAYSAVSSEIESIVKEGMFALLFPNQESFQAPGSWMEEAINMNKFCGDLDVADSQNPRNIRKIQEGMGIYFEYLRDTAVESYGKLYRGKFQPVNNQNCTCFSLRNTQMDGRG
jgi:hypothetical protein